VATDATSLALSAAERHFFLPGRPRFAVASPHRVNLVLLVEMIAEHFSGRQP